MTARDLAGLVIETLDAQQAYFADRRNALSSTGLLIASKKKEAELRTAAEAILSTQGSLFTDETTD